MMERRGMRPARARHAFGVTPVGFLASGARQADVVLVLGLIKGVGVQLGRARAMEISSGVQM
jgi:hypothetical protein